MAKKPIGLNDLLPNRGKGVKEEVYRANADPIGYELLLYEESNILGYEQLVGRYQQDIEAGLPHDARLEAFVLKVLQSDQVRAALFPRYGAGKPADDGKLERDYQYAREVARLIEFGGYGKDKAREEVATRHGVSISTIRDAYKEYGEAAHRATEITIKPTDKF